MNWSQHTLATRCKPILGSRLNLTMVTYRQGTRLIHLIIPSEGHIHHGEHRRCSRHISERTRESSSLSGSACHTGCVWSACHTCCVWPFRIPLNFTHTLTHISKPLYCFTLLPTPILIFSCHCQLHFIWILFVLGLWLSSLPLTFCLHFLASCGFLGIHFPMVPQVACTQPWRPSSGDTHRVCLFLITLNS